MKTLKLEVGKTYINRKGDKVRIVKKDDAPFGPYPYRSEDGYSYQENGRFWHTEWTDDLIEEVPEPRYAFITPEEAKKVTATRYTFTIPDGVKELTVEQEGNRLVVEMVPEDKAPKPGDVMINEHNSVYIFKAVANNDYHTHYAWLAKPGRLFIDYGCCAPGRPATPEEAKPLLDALRKAGKWWNQEAMKVEDVPEPARIMSFVQGYVNNVTWNYEQPCSLIQAYLKYREGEK